MEREGRQPVGTTKGRTRVLRAPLLVSLLVHALALGGALVWAAGHGAAPEPLRIGRLDVRTHDEDAALPPEPEDVVPPPLDAFELPDALADVVLEPVQDEPEARFEEQTEDVLPPPTAFEPLPLDAARGRRRPPPQPAPGVQPPPPTPRPTTVYVRPQPPTPAPPPPRVAPSPTRRSPLRVVWAPDPRRYYPQSARSSGLGGRVLVRLTVDARGRVTHASVEQSSGDGALDSAALTLAYAYRFNPGTGLRGTRLPVTFEPPTVALGS